MSASQGARLSSSLDEESQNRQRRFVHTESDTVTDSGVQQANKGTPRHNKSGKSRSAQLRRAAPSRLSITTSEIEQGATHLLSKSPALADIEDHVDLAYTNRFNKAAKYLQVTDHVKVSKPTIDAVQTLLCAGPTRGRKYSVSSALDSSNPESWIFRIVNDADSNDRVRVGTSKTDYSFTLPVDRSVAPEESSGRLVAEQLCRIFVCVFCLYGDTKGLTLTCRSGCPSLNLEKALYSIIVLR